MNDTLEQALVWHSQNITPIPCEGKVARVPWACWQNKLPPQLLVERWFSTPANLALICGGQSGLVVLDFDNLATYKKWRLTHPGYRDSYTVATPRPGKHVYFFCNEPVNTTLHPVDGLDIKAQGGYVIAPPSSTERGVYQVWQDSAIMHIDKLDCVPQKEAKCEQPKGAGKTKTQYVGNAAASQDLIAQIKAKLPILNLVSRYTEPIPSSRDGRYFVASCPFHQPDNKPSFWIDSGLNLCGCFKPECQTKQYYRKPMDVINFYARLHGCDNTRAICDLAQELDLWCDIPSYTEFIFAALPADE